MGALTIRELDYLFNPNSTQIYARQRIKDKIRDAYVLLDTILKSKKIEEFANDLVPFVHILVKLSAIIPNEIYNEVIQELLSDENGGNGG